VLWEKPWSDTWFFNPNAFQCAMFPSTGGSPVPQKRPNAFIDVAVL
jgi:hypothetical protein